MPYAVENCRSETARGPKRMFPGRLEAPSARVRFMSDCVLCTDLLPLPGRPDDGRGTRTRARTPIRPWKHLCSGCHGDLLGTPGTSDRTPRVTEWPEHPARRDGLGSSSKRRV